MVSQETVQVLDSAKEKMAASLQSKQPPSLTQEEVQALYELLDEFVYIDYIDISNPAEVAQLLKNTKEKN